jgi:hypothetical protein
MSLSLSPERESLRAIHFCPSMDEKHPRSFLLVSDFPHPLLTSLSFLSNSIEGSAGAVSLHQVASHVPSLPLLNSQMPLAHENALIFLQCCSNLFALP